MKWLAPTLVIAALLLQFTAPDGSPIYFSKTEIISLSSPATCSEPAKSRVLTSMGSICIRETLEQAVKKYEALQ